MIPYTTLDSIIAQMPERTGHTLLNEDQGCVKGCRMGVSLYRNTEYHMPQKHDDQEGFFVLDGKGYALIDGEEIPLLPGTAFMVPAHTDHVIRRDPPVTAVRYCGSMPQQNDPQSPHTARSSGSCV